MGRSQLQQDRPVACTLPEAELAVHAAGDDAPIRQVLAGGDPPAGAHLQSLCRPWPQPIGQPSQAMRCICPQRWSAMATACWPASASNAVGLSQRWPVHRCRLAALQLCGFDYLGAVGGAVARTCRLVLLTPKPSQPGIGTSPRCCLALHHLSAVLHCCWVYRSLNSVHPRQSMATPRHFSSCGGAAAEETRWWGTLQLSL